MGVRFVNSGDLESKRGARPFELVLERFEVGLRV
jgi:hypothetical protein